MKREFLKSLGLTDEIADKVIAEHGKDVQTANSKIATAEQERDSYKEQITERDKQLKELNDNSGNNKELQEQIKQLQEDNKTASSKYQTELANVQKDNAIKLALKDSKAKDADMVFKSLKLDDVKLEDGKLTGLDSQLEDLKKSHDYMFDAETKKADPINAFVGGNPSGGSEEENSLVSKIASRMTGK